MRSRQFLWLSAAVLAPCIVLTVLFLRLLDQERQLESRRATEAAQQRLTSARQNLLAQIEPHRLGQTAGSQISFRGVIENGRIRMAWELHHSTEDMKALESAVRSNDAALFRRLAGLPQSATDEHGVPVAVYAIPHLASDEQQRQQVRLRAEAAANPHPLSAMGLRLIHAPAALIEAAQQGESFRQQTWKTLPSEGQWLAWGQPLQLIGFAPSTQPGQLVFRAVTAPSGLALDKGELLGPPFVNVRAQLPAPAPEDGSRNRTLLVTMFAFTLLGALFAGVLLLRDARREQALAGLRTQFIAGVSHELRTPLTALRIFIESMKMTPDLDPATRAEYLDTMLHETERLSRLVNNVLEFSRIERQTKTYTLAPIALRAVIESLLATAGPMLERAGFTLKADLQDSPPLIHADRDALEQALLNLITNAMKYSGRSREIHIKVAADGPHAAIVVRDFGIGIPRNQQDRIFESFYRIPSTENKNIQGAGLGLTLVKHVMEGHGGAVTVESEPGRGSAFRLLIPL
ncbi:MAG: hypothetical protein HY820_03445 [Acidobacteria bacterium]|nr:hypothetical protein [Acidobacteriota bacterium]